MVSPAVKREAATWLMKDFGVSQRRACRTLEFSLGTCRYESRRQDGGVLRTRILALAEQRPRFGYRRIWVLLRREGHLVNAKRVYRLYRLERLKLRTKKRKRVSRETRTPLLEPNTVNERWSMDFVSDQLANSLRFRTLNVVDDCSREALAIEAARSLPGSAVVGVLDAVAQATRLSETDRHRQRSRISRPSSRRLGLCAWRRAPVHRPGKADAERVRRKFQRSVSRRVSQPALVRQPGGRPAHDRTMAPGLQHGATP